MRCLERTRVDHLKKDPDFIKLVDWVNKEGKENYSLELAGDCVQVYKNGEKFLLDVKNTGSEKNNDEKTCCTPSTYACYTKGKSGQIELSVFLENINEYVKNQEAYFNDRTRKRTANSEKEFQYRLAKALTTPDNGRIKHYSVIPEYIQTNADDFRIDLVVVEMTEKERPHLILVEVKRGAKSVSGKKGIKSHLKTYTNVISSDVKSKTMVCDSELVFMQKAELGIIPNISPEQAINLTDIDYSKTTILFVLADIEKDNRTLKKECLGIDWNKYCSFPIEFAFVDSSDCDFANYKKESIEEFSKRWKAN